DGNKAAEATLSNVDDGVNVKLVGDGLPEEKAKHGFHVHEKGICEPKDFESAGGHYNPLNKNHGKEDKDGQHAGDFDNIDRKSTRLNSSHVSISYAVFCLKNKSKTTQDLDTVEA